MELEKQVCSLALAKRLEELGVKQETALIWVDGKKPYLRESDMKGCARCGAIINGIMPPRTVPTYSAFTVAELGEMLPPCIGDKILAVTKREDGWHVTYSSLDKWWRREVADTEADARTKMLIYLLENNLLTV